MHPYLSAALAGERQKELAAAADRHRRAAAAAPPTLRLRLGRRLVLIGSHISGETGLIGHPRDSR